MRKFFPFLRRLSAAVLSALILFTPLQAFALTTVSNAYDQPTSLVISERSNHHLSLTLNGAWSEGETLALTFDTGFNLTGVTEDDVDLADDSVDHTTAADCSGTEKASVSVASQTVTFTLCSGDGGAMASGSVVDIEIGTNAASSGTGTSRILNPSTIGTYYINVSGTLNQTGSIPVPIVSRDASDVSAIVSGGGESGGGGSEEESEDDTITLSVPNGGETYTEGDAITITWSTTGTGISYVDLYYSTDGGLSYTLIAADETDDGSYAWTAPAVETTLAVVRVEGTDGALTLDLDDSDAVFTIVAIDEEDIVTILAPAGGETYVPGDEVEITWETEGDEITEIDIYYSDDGGTTLTPIAEGDADDGSYSWTIPDGLTGEEIVIIVSGTDGVTEIATDTSASFVIEEEPVEAPTPTVTVTDPNGGEAYEAGDAVTITWETTGDVTSVSLYYSTDGGGSYTSIASGETNDGSYAWTAPSAATTEALVLIYGYTETETLSDTSDDTFTITVPAPDDSEITVVYPNGGETFEGGSVVTVTWSTTGSSITSVLLAYSLDNGSSYTRIAGGETDDGSYDWTVPDVATTQALIRIVGGDGSVAYSADISDEVFTITSSEEEEVVPDISEEEEEGETEAGTSPDTTSTGETTPTVTGRFLVANDAINLSISNEVIEVLANSSVRVVADVSQPEGVVSVVFSYMDEEFTASSYGTASWEYVLSIDTATTAPIGMVVSYEDGTSITATYTLEVESAGEVYEYVDGEFVPVSDAVIIIYSVSDGARSQFRGEAYSVTNPLVSDEEGILGWYVPNGSYVVTAGKTGYEDAEYSASVRNNILSPLVEMERQEEKEQTDTTPTNGATRPPTNSGGSVVNPDEETAPAAEGVDVTWTEFFTTSAGLDVIQEVLASPAAETTADIAAPVAAVSAVASGALLLSVLDLLPLLQYLFSAPILFLARRQRQTFGTIYHGITKVPIDLAIVRLLNASGKIIRTMVTDKEGRYFFKADPGIYLLSVTKRGFIFPSTYVGHVKEDGKYLDVYTGGNIQVTDRDAIITANIPIDPADSFKKHQAVSLKLARFLRIFQEVVALSGVFASLAVVVIRPSAWHFGLFFINLGVYLLIWYFVKAHKPKGWGIVFDEGSNKKIGNVVVRLFEPKYNKLIESTLTDRRGRYAFMVGPNEYYVTFEKNGFAKQEVRPIDYKEKKGSTLLSVDVSMRQQKGDV